MDNYRLFAYRDDGQIVGSAVVIDAANDDEAIAQAEVVRGSFAAELLDIEGLRIVKYLPARGEALRMGADPDGLRARGCGQRRHDGGDHRAACGRRRGCVA
jgi:hypothetical protein